MVLVVAGVVLTVIGLPHLLRLRAAPPGAAAALWMSSLVLRAAVVTAVGLYGVLFLPRTNLFHDLTRWCLDTALPLLRDTVRLEGHAVGDAAVLLPLILVVAGLCWVALQLVRAGSAGRRLILGHRLGPGPEGTIIVPGGGVLLAAVGLVRPSVIVSAGALVALDDEELSAGIAHERGHISRCHRVWLALAEVCGAVGRPIPGGKTAHAELELHLERDADRYALRHHDRLALASVICKAAATGPSTSPALAALSGPPTSERVRQLLDDPADRPSLGSRMVAALAILAVLCTIGAAGALPGLAAIGAHASPAAGHHSHHGR